MGSGGTATDVVDSVGHEAMMAHVSNNSLPEKWSQKNKRVIDRERQKETMWGRWCPSCTARQRAHLPFLWDRGRPPHTGPGHLLHSVRQLHCDLFQKRSHGRTQEECLTGHQGIP